MLRRLLSDAEEELLHAERAQLLALRGPLANLDAPADDLALLERGLLQLDELFLLVVVGEFNAGKSAFINALLGQRFLPEGVTPTTTQINILKYGEETRAEVTPTPPERRAGQSAADLWEPAPSLPRSASDIAVLAYPVEWLREINIVDTPGTNAVIQRHQKITEEFIPRADLVLFVTSADRPFSESERAFLQRIREWGKKVVVVVNKIDILETPADVEHVLVFVETNGRELLGRKPIIFPVSARQARQAKETLDADERTRLWAASRFEPLERYLLDTLDERERLRLKLANPLGVAQRLAERYLQIAQARRSVLRDDVATVRTVEAQLAAYESDMRRDFKYHLSHVDNVLYAMSDRGNAFFDETIRIGRLLDLLNADKVRGLFEREVVADTAGQVETHTHEVIDWLVGQDYRQWQAVTEYLSKRVTRHEGQMVGRVEGGFDYNRQALLESVGRAARQIVTSYDKEVEAQQLAESVQLALAQTAIVEVGAIGLGALLVKLLATTLADVSGVLAASALAALGLYLLPNKRRRAKNDLAAKVADLRVRLTAALTTEFETELGKSLQRIREAMRPYTRFVETQQATLADTETALREAQRAMGELAGRIETLM